MHLLPVQPFGKVTYKTKNKKPWQIQTDFGSMPSEILYSACLYVNAHACARVSVCVVQWLLGFTNRNCVLLLYVLVLVPVWQPVLKSSLFLKTSLFFLDTGFSNNPFSEGRKNKLCQMDPQG